MSWLYCLFFKTVSCLCLVSQLQGLSHNVIFTLDSLLKGDLKGVKGVSVQKSGFPLQLERPAFSLCFQVTALLVSEK